MAGEQSPTRSPEFLETLLGAAADAPVYVYDRELRAVDFFWGGEPLRWGIDPTAPLGRRVSEIVAPADAVPFERMVREVFETGEPRRFEGLFHLPVGEVWFEVRLAPLRRAGGDVLYVVSVSRDITERRVAEEALRRTQRRFEMLAEVVPVGIARTHAAGNIT
jgi:PAS domain-containing protein